MDQKLLDALKNVSPTELAKAAHEAYGLHGIIAIKDHWTDNKTMHEVPTSEAHPTGPAMISSGRGAEEAIKNYSKPAPQVGLTEEYNEKDKYIADFGTAVTGMKSEMKTEFTTLGETFKSGIASLIDVLKSSKSPTKSVKADALSKGWTDLGSLVVACSELEGEKHDVEGLNAARHLIEEAESHLDAVESHEKTELRDMEMNAAYKSMVKAWDALAKARKVERMSGLDGDGNQEDSAVPGKDGSPDKHEAITKARYYASKAGYKLVKAEDMKEEKEEKKEEKKMSKDPDPDPDPKKMHKDPDPDPDPKCKADVIAALRASIKALEMGEEKEEKKEEKMHKDPDPDPDPKKMSKDPDPDPDPKKMSKDPDPDPDPAKKSNLEIQLKNALSRIGQLEKAQKDRSPQMTPIILSESGELVKSPEVMSKALVDRVETLVDNGEMSEEHASIVRSIIDRAKAVAKAHIPQSVVDRSIAQAPMEVKNFFENYTNTLN